jgi:hypothetical protein
MALEPRNPGSLRQAIRGVGERMVEAHGLLTPDAANELLGETEWGQSAADESEKLKAESYAAAMILGVIAHELGHIALAHPRPCG